MVEMYVHFGQLSVHACGVQYKYVLNVHPGRGDSNTSHFMMRAALVVG